MKGSLTLCILLGLIFVSHTQVLGIDFGTQFWKAALISPGKNLVIVENSRSQRKTLNSIAFHEGVRFFEDESRNKRMKKPHLSYFYLNKLIKSLDEQPIESYKFENDTYIIEQGDTVMTLEQVIAMILKNIKNYASLQAGTDIKDVVLAVPANWGFKAKMSLVNSAYLAQLSVLGLVNQNSAAAINFAITRNDTDPLNIVFFNLGSHNLQVSIMKMFGYFDEAKNKTVQSLQALSHVVAENVGGLKIDEQIAHYLAEEFYKKHKINPKQNRRSFTKLLVKSSEIKETLSANKETNVYLQGLIDGIDLNFGIKRSIIDQTNTFRDFEKLLTEALEKANLSKDDIHSVQLIGGSSRIPKVSSIVKKYFDPIEVGAHINGDQAMAFGCALRAANLSLTFRVKQLHFYDGLNINTRAVISSEEKGVIAEQELFTLADQHGQKKTIEVEESSQNVKISIYGGDELLKQYTTKGMNEWKAKYENQNLTGEPKLMLDFSMSSVHIAQLKDAYLNINLNISQIKEKVQYVEEQQQIEVEVEVKEEEEQKKEQENVQNSQNTLNAEQKVQQNAEQVEKSNEQTEEKKEEQKVEQQENAQQGEEKKQKKTQKRKEKVKKTKTIKNNVEEFRIQEKKQIISFEESFTKYARYNKEQLDEKKKTLHKYQDYEKQLKEKAKIRNDFESALYHLKDNFEDEGLKTFSQEEQLTLLKEIVLRELEWMDENAWTAQKLQFEEHFKSLTDTYEPIYNRTVEYRNREKTYNESFKYLGTVYQKTQQLLITHPWIEEQVTGQLKKINETAEWIQSKLKEQIDKPLNENPIIYNHEMIFKAEQLRDHYYLLKLIPRPKVDPKKKEQPKKETAEQQMDLDDEQSKDEEVKEEQEVKAEENIEQQDISTDEEQENEEESNEQSEKEQEKQDL